MGPDNFIFMLPRRFTSLFSHLILCFVSLLATTNVSATELSIAPGGMTLHYIPVSSNLAENMPRRITDDGRFVWNPGLFVNYRNERGLFVSGGMVKDCYNNWAGYALAGREWIIESWLRWGLIGGLYGRQLPNVVQHRSDGSTVIIEDALNRISVVFNGTDGPTFGIVPMAGPYVNLAAPVVKEKVDVEWMTFGTAVLFFSTLGVRVHF